MTSSVVRVLRLNHLTNRHWWLFLIFVRKLKIHVASGPPGKSASHDRRWAKKEGVFSLVSIQSLQLSLIPSCNRWRPLNLGLFCWVLACVRNVFLFKQRHNHVFNKEHRQKVLFEWYVKKFLWCLHVLRENQSWKMPWFMQKIVLIHMFEREECYS